MVELAVIAQQQQAGRILVEPPDRLYAAIAQGSREQPAIKARSIHHLKKTVAGVPLLRPAWFFNIGETGEGIADVGTHVVDLVQWTAFPRDLVDYRTDIRLLSARRWPTPACSCSKGNWWHSSGRLGRASRRCSTFAVACCGRDSRGASMCWGAT